tara:strand:- start:863 stop:1081 length:219 start_codon:yes stop_codon:yes gene_type:complete
MKFGHIVNNYRVLYNLGMKIINHKSRIKFVPYTALENAKQDARIQKFERLLKNNQQDWKKNKNSINEYWTGD